MAADPGERGCGGERCAENARARGVVASASCIRDRPRPRGPAVRARARGGTGGPFASSKRPHRRPPVLTVLLVVTGGSRRRSRRVVRYAERIDGPRDDRADHRPVQGFSRARDLVCSVAPCGWVSNLCAPMQYGHRSLPTRLTLWRRRACSRPAPHQRHLPRDALARRC